MSTKKSYMNVSNIIKEGVIDKIFDFIKNNKIKNLKKILETNLKLKRKYNV